MLELFLIVTLMLTLWCMLYHLSHILAPVRPDKTKNSSEWHCRRITVIHAVVVVFLSAWSAFVQGPWPFTHPAEANTPLHHWTCTLSLSYFIFDFAWCIYYRTEGPVMLFHHLLSIFGNSLVLVRGINGAEMMACLFGTELTNPVLQLRWFLRQDPQMAKSSVCVFVDIVFIFLFTFMRIGLASVLLVYYMTNPKPDWMARAGGYAIYLVGWVFWFSLMRYALRKYVWKPSGRPHRVDKNGVSKMNGIIGQTDKEADVANCGDTIKYSGVRNRGGVVETLSRAVEDSDCNEFT